ncbi:MAG TPA: stage II sporulation protein P [Syntrophomonas sp.]|jgi:stage II sporulation protein P|nr:stage II sporulation protein P [Syntrophomonas sp.]
MNKINRKYFLTFFGVLIIVMVAAYILNIMVPRSSKPAPSQQYSYDSQYPYVTIRDTNGKLVLQTGIPVHIDDEYINEKNYHYRIIKVDGNKATARLVNSPEYTKQTNTNLLSLLPFSQSKTTQAGAPIHVVLYHTHSDESYTPTSGTPSEPGNGDIYQVGDTIATVLTQAGISVSHSRAKHDPHDINAYHRSRRTITRLLKERPDAAFDIHRDSAPVSAYETTINGIATSRVMIVVGRSNPNTKTNLQYARLIKNRADRLHPGLMRGIFMGKGDYNQDLYPTALLFEIGTEGISLDEAQKAAACLSDAIIGVTYAR